MFKLFLFLFSISFRSAYVQPNPTDYEITAGLENKKSHYIFLWERENGSYYKGLDLFYNSKYLSTQYFRKDAYNVKTFEVNLKYPYKKKFEIGYSRLRDYKIDKYKNLLYLNLKTKYLKIKYQNNFTDYYKLEVKFKSYKYGSIEPLIIYRDYNKKKFWQLKFILRVKI